MQFSSWLCGILMTLTVFGRSITVAGDGFEDNPMGHVNLSPLQQWANAYRCLQNRNMTESCPGKYKLTYHGWVNLTTANGTDYCGDCGNRTQWVLKCIHWMKTDFKFVDGTTAADVNNTITQGCANGFKGVVQRVQSSNATKLLENKMAFVISTAAAAVLLFISDIL